MKNVFICFVIKSRDRNHLFASLVPLYDAINSLAFVEIIVQIDFRSKISQIYLQCDC